MQRAFSFIGCCGTELAWLQSRIERYADSHSSI
jgi:hypothetical protein